MKAGRVIGGEEHDAKKRADAILADARAAAETVLAGAKAEADQLKRDASALATTMVSDARREVARISAATDDERVFSRDPELATTRAVESSGFAGARSDAEGRRGVWNDVPGGTVDEVVGLLVRATIPRVALGELVRIDRREREPLPAEVVGFRGEQAVLLPLGELAGVAPASIVWRTGTPLQIRCGDDLLGRVLDGIGQPLDGGPALIGEKWDVDRPAPSPLARPAITAPLPTGVRALDTMLTLGRGQRIGLFAAAGVGKSTLLGQIARNAIADVIVVCQVGERGRELAELLGDELAPARARTVVVCATSDAPALVRLRAVHVATAIAEWFRDMRGASVLLLCDSLTRVARAQREVGLSAGEPPARHGYPPSVFALLPRLIERTGATTNGVITAIYTVLVAGNDLDEPIADEVRGLVDGHVILDRRLAQRGHFPPIDVVSSVSRLMARVVDPAHAEAAAKLRARLAVYEENRDLITLGAYQKGRDATIDAAIAAYPGIEAHLRQRREETIEWDSAVDRLLALGRKV